ncbi:hypothetical protein POTOM_016754 [Populus tomentosa]|uniref:pectinesterase n=1 Tax=Populus tomentosa TaxID=118781 RepID=A0A8X8CV53_POPTO|nr:hypothetical protein POTOM_016754 [Populus tomentosa]
MILMCREQVNIPIEKPCIFLEGNGGGQTTVTYNAHQDTADSATFTSSPSNIVVKGITFEGCIINVTSEGFITAQGKEFPNDTNGFVFSHCYVTGVKGAKAYLGRAYGGYSTVIYNDVYLSDVVQPEGWFAWDYMGHKGNITYVEANCKGPRANTLSRVKWEKKLTRQ